MAPSGLSLAFLILASGLRAQAPEVPFGLKLGKVPEVVYAQVPQLSNNQGILVEAAEPDSPAWRGGLRPFDVIVALDAQPLADSRGVVEKLHQLRPGQSAAVTLFRAGREMVLAFDAHHKEDAHDNWSPKALLKPGGPPAVTIHLQTMSSGRLNLILSYYSDNS